MKPVNSESMVPGADLGVSVPMPGVPGDAVLPEAARRPLRELMDDRLLDALLERSRDQAGGLRLTGEGSMLGELVRAVLERALEAELTAHLGYGKSERGGAPAGKRTAVLGIAFKPNSDDIRDSPSLDICDRLRSEGAIVTVHDPVAMANAARSRPDLRYAASVSEAAEGADLVLHLTEWADYRAIDPAALGQVVARRAIIDARCALDITAWRNAGWTLRAPGRPEQVQL